MKDSQNFTNPSFNLNSKTSYISEESFTESHDSTISKIYKSSLKRSPQNKKYGHSERRQVKNVTFYDESLK